MKSKSISKLGKLLVIVMAVFMMFGMLPTNAFADTELGGGETSIGDIPTPIGETPTSTKAYLEELAFATMRTSQYKNNLQLSPAFDKDVYEYTLNITDNTKDLYMWIKAPSNYELQYVKANYKNASDENTSATVKNEQKLGTKIDGVLTKQSLNGHNKEITFTLDPQIEGIDAAEYKITLKKTFTLSSLILRDNSDENVTFALDKKFSFSEYEYTASVPSNAKISVEAQTITSSLSTVEVVGAIDNVFTPTFDDKHECVMSINVKAEGTSTTTYKVKLIELPQSIKIESAPSKTTYYRGDTFDPTGMTIKAVYSSGEEAVDLNDVTISPSGAITKDSEFKVTYKGVSADITGIKVKTFKGTGKQSDPYLLENADDLSVLSEEVNSGETFYVCYFKITDNITLPNNWTPIGTLKEGVTYLPTLKSTNYYTFEGYIDGKKSDTENYLITVPSGSKPLIGCPKYAKFSNIDIYGEKIDGYGLVEYYCVGSTCGIDNVNIKSGSNIKKSGLIGGDASGSNSVVISNCTVEHNVTIGNPALWEDLTNTYKYDFVANEVQYNDMVGSFAGAFNGTIRNCVSYATIYGRNYVGGIVGFKGQSMGDFIIDNCVFDGKVIATGEYVGGIVGSGYSASSAGNTPAMTIQNCLVTGSVEGFDKVGSITGGNEKLACTYNNGIGYIRGNVVTGSVSATAENATVGGIIGYIKVINKYNIIDNNYYLETIASNGIGKVNSVDNTSDEYKVDETARYNEPIAVKASELTDGSLIAKLNNAGSGTNVWKQGDETPVHTNATRIYNIKSEWLHPMTARTFNSSKGYDNYNNASCEIKAYYSDGTAKTISPTVSAINGPDFTKAGFQLCSLTYDGYEMFYGINVNNDGECTDPELNNVQLGIYGDTVHTVDKDNVHTLAGNNLIKWINNAVIFVEDDTTALDVLTKASQIYGFTFNAEDTGYGKYVNSVTYGGVTLDATSNKQSDDKSYSGWQFTLNGESVLTSLDKTKVKANDKILFYFEDDYSLAYVDTAINAIKAIPTTLTKDNKGKVTEAENSLLYLSPIAMDKVKADENYKKLTDAQTKLANAKAFDTLADKIPANVTLDNKADVKTAYDKFQTLTDEEKALVADGNAAKVEEATKKIADLETAAAVDTLIDEIGTPVTLGSKKSIRNARKAYNDLTKAQKALVKKLADLERAEAELSPLVIKQAEDLINNLPKKDEITLNDKEAIEEARAAYDELTEDEKKEISNDILKKLTDAEKAYEKLVPKTGDSYDVFAYGVALLVSSALLAGIVMYRKKKRNVQ